MENPTPTSGREPADSLELLKNLAPADADETHRALSEIVTGLLATPPAPAQQLEILEAARERIHAAQAELAACYATHPLPPDSRDNETLARVVALWRGVAQAYARVADTDASDGSPSKRALLLAQRRVDAAGKVLLEYFRAHQAVPAGVWSDLHAGYAAAEALAQAQVRVADTLNEVWKAQSTAEAYVAVLLVDLANPFGRSAREFDWVCRWAQRFAPYCTLEADTDDEATKPTAYGLDLAGDDGLRPLGILAPSASVRRFDGSRLAAQIRGVIGRFKAGAAPASLGLGADCPPEAAHRLLVSLYRPWALSAAGRRFTRRRGRGEAELCGDWLAIGYNVAGKPFEQPVLYSASPRQDETDPRLQYGRMARDWQSHRDAERRGFAAERWAVFDQSVSGFRLIRQPQQERIEHRQLVGIRPPDGDRFLLGQVSWLMYRDDGVMEAGIQVLPGLPKIVPARRFDLFRGRHIAYQPAFLLPGLPALKTGPSLVLPAGWYRPQGVIEIVDDKGMELRLTDIVLRGTNFDQVSFEPVVARDVLQGTAH
ncbi:hypothetical protein [Aromatoleum sp.]|uniref:hypothetical protein n=1 Tax=Aromatoleum sp. TaxID=2307007 RepID=UPI002FC93BEF